MNLIYSKEKKTVSKLKYIQKHSKIKVVKKRINLIKDFILEEK